MSDYIKKLEAKKSENKKSKLEKPIVEFEGPKEPIGNLVDILVNPKDLIENLPEVKLDNLEEDIEVKIEIPLDEIKMLIRSAKSKWSFGKGKYPNMEVIIKNVVKWVKRNEQNGNK